MTRTGNDQSILIIDDEPAIQNLCARILGQAGYHPVAPAFGSGAVDLALEGAYDLLLCDIRMPDLNGLELFRRLRKRNPDVVAVMITGHATVESVIEALNDGVDGFLQKPFRAQELIEAVENALRKSRQRRENFRMKALMPLLELNRLLISDIDNGSLFGAALRIVRQKLRADRVSFLLEDEEQEDLLTVVAAHGLSPRHSLPKDVREDGGIIGHVFRTGRPLLIDEELADPSLRRLMRHDGVRSGLCIPVQAGGKTVGCLCASRLKTSEPFTRSDLDLFMIIGNQVGSHLENMRLYGALRSSYLKTIKALTGAIEAKDAYTKGHSYQVAVYATRIGRKMGLAAAEVENLRIAGMLHDVGKIGIPEELLVKPGGLSKEEREVMKIHPFYGLKILEPIGLPQPVLCAIHHHHERYDGAGYPDGLSGEEIPLFARILQVADAIDAMTSDRPYRGMQSWEYVESELLKHRGRQFDPSVVDSAVELARDGRLFDSEHPCGTRKVEAPDRQGREREETGSAPLPSYSFRALPLALPD